MKRILLALTLTMSVLGIQAQNNLDGPVMDFETSVMDYGLIEHNSDGNRDFILTNTGNAPLIISNAKGSCGCTVPTWSRDPLPPGETTKIGVKYATNRIGKFTKTITLTTNAAEKTKILTIKGEVKKPIEGAIAPSKPKTSPLEVN